MKILIAALFVQEGGCYTELPFVDPWTEQRDARTYNGNYPVIAHPPCQLWGSLAAVNYARWGGEHNKPGNDGGCFTSALASVRRCGGVLEHPSGSRAFKAHRIEPPTGIGWKQINKNEWGCTVWQSAYGHRANKSTWLFYCGNSAPHELRWDRQKGTHQIGFQDRRGKLKNKPTLSKVESNATPTEFRDELIKLALGAL